MRKLLLLVLFVQCSIITNLKAQTVREVKGVVVDSLGKGIPAATVKLIAGKDTLATICNVMGDYSFKGVKAANFTLLVSSLGFRNLSRVVTVDVTKSSVTLDPVKLKDKSNMLGEVTISGVLPITIKDDTVEYKASAYKVKENAVAEDLLKKLPGVDVDKDGNVQAHGQKITKIRVNGKPFFNGDLKTATQNLPANIIDKVQVIDDYGDQANFTGIKDGDAEKIINIELKPDKNRGLFGRLSAGVGSDDRYLFNGMANFFENARQISVLANLNNINAQAFNFGGGGGRNSGGTPGNGISKVGSAGINFRDEWGKKVSVNGSYSYSNNHNNTLTDQSSQTTTNKGVIYRTLNGEADNTSNSHRFNWDVDYRPNLNTQLKVSPVITYTGSQNNGNTASVQTGAIRQDQVSSSGSNLRTPAISGTAIFNHRFEKKGRSISAKLAVTTNDSRNDQTAMDSIRYYDQITNVFLKDSILHRLIANKNLSRTDEVNVTYSEPLSLRSRLEFSYNYNSRNYDNSRLTHTVDRFGVDRLIDSLSNVYNYSFTTQRIGANFKNTQKRYNYSLGLTVQPSLLKGNSVTRNTETNRNAFNIFPVARLDYNFSKTRSFRIHYNGRSNEPSFAQIQPVRDVTNPQHPIVGNPDLKASFNHSVSLQYNDFNPNAGSSLFVNLSGNTTQNQIVSNNVLIPDALNSFKQETRYLNANGFYSVNGSYNWSRPFGSDRKYVLSFNGSANYNNNISFTDNQKNIGRNWALSQGTRMQINPVEWIELNPSVAYSYNTNQYSLSTSNSTTIKTWSFNMDGKVYFLNTFIVGFDGSKSLNSGYSGSLATNPLILNAYLEKQFFAKKNGTLRLQAYDLFNQGNNISQAITDNSVTDSKTNRLTRYFMLTFTMRMNKFKGAKS